MDPSILGSVAAQEKKTFAERQKPTPFARLPRTERLTANGAMEDPPSDDEGEKAEDSDDEGKGGKKGETSEEREKRKMRGRGKSLKRFLRKKKKNVIDPSTVRRLRSRFFFSLLLLLSSHVFRADKRLLPFPPQVAIKARLAKDREMKERLRNPVPEETGALLRFGQRRA